MEVIGMDIFAFRVSGQNQAYKVHLAHGLQIPEPQSMHRLNAPHVWLQFSVPKFGGMTYYGTKMSERFLIPIEPEAFASLALEMMRADPVAAIKAFGAAMQTVDAAEI